MKEQTVINVILGLKRRRLEEVEKREYYFKTFNELVAQQYDEQAGLIPVKVDSDFVEFTQSMTEFYSAAVIHTEEVIKILTGFVKSDFGICIINNSKY